MQLTGIHHVTAITAQAARNVEFYTQVLGLRLVKKTVNQDDVSAYHLFYADKLGSPGTDVTFFDWPQIVKNQNGAGSISEISLRVPGGTPLAWWASWLSRAGVEHSGIVAHLGEQRLSFADPEGQALALVDDGGAPGGAPWEHSPVPVEQAIRGIHAVRLTVHSIQPTAQVLTDVLGFRQIQEYSLDASGRTLFVFETGTGGPGAQVHVETGPHLEAGRQGYGGVHHIAFRTPNDEEHRAWQSRIAMSGLNVTPIIDRFYFKSIYFREPGGILFEIATDGPGFSADEPTEHLGERLSLPPFLEPQRQRIEAGLHSLEI